jgi:hypothetical protein
MMMQIRFPVKRNMAKEIKIASNEAYPSMPSRKLKRFINHTIPKITRGYRTRGELSSNPEIDIGFIPFKKYMANPAVNICIEKRMTGFSPIRSSIILTPASNNPLNRVKYNCLSMSFKKNIIEIPIYQAITIARPPPLGVGTSCELLSFGISRIL